MANSMTHSDAMVLIALLSVLAGFIAPFAVDLACEQIAWLCRGVAGVLRRMFGQKKPSRPKGALWTLSPYAGALQRIVDDLDRKRGRDAE